MASLNWEERENVLIVTFIDREILSDNRVQQVGQELMAMVDKAVTNRRLLLNFENVRAMSSAMIGKLVFVNKKCKDQNVTLKMCNVHPNVLEVFRRTFGDDGPGLSGLPVPKPTRPDSDGGRANPPDPGGSEQ